MPAQNTVQRKYRLRKIQAGDYLLPSNDLSQVWRISTYEDGPSHGLDPEDFPRDREFWGCWRWSGDPNQITVESIEDWIGWVLEVSGYETRAEAIDAALDDSVSKSFMRR